MKLDRQLARILVAAIVMIAAYFAPSFAQAHAGHHQPASATVFVAVAALEFILAGSPAEIAKSALALEPGPDQVLTAAHTELSAQLRARTGPCCSHGAACCAHALVGESNSPAPVGAASRTSAIPDDLGCPSFDAEALPEPPKAFV